MAYVSPLVLAEVLVLPLREGNRRLARAYRTLLARGGLFAHIPFDNEIAELAAGMRARIQRLKLADAVHGSAAIHAGCRALLSADKALKAAVKERIEVLAFDEIEV